MARDRNPAVVCLVGEGEPDGCPSAEYVDPGEDVFAFRARIEAKGWRVAPGGQWCPRHSGKWAE